MSEKKSPPRKDKWTPSVKPVSVSHPTSSLTKSATDHKNTLKRKLFPVPQTDEEEKKVVLPPKRKKATSSFAVGSPTSSPSPPSVSSTTTPSAKCPAQSTVWPVAPLSERQQLALLMKMTADQKRTNNNGDSSPRPSSPSTPGSGAKKTPQEKKVHKRNERGETALHISAIKGDAKQTKRLIKAGADVNVKDFAGWTPLHEACNHGWLYVAKQLLKAGANVNCQGLDNDTPLHDASINGHRKLVELLLRHGANPLQANTKGLTPFDVAANPGITQLLRKEIITSSSESSSVDEVRSPTSPESLSDRDEDKAEATDTLKFPAPGTLGQQELSASASASAAGSRRSSANSDKIGSPRLTLKFHKNKDSERKSKEKDYFKSYSVQVEEDKNASELFDDDDFRLSSVVNSAYLDKKFKMENKNDKKDPYAFEDISDEDSDKGGPVKSRPSERLEFKVADFGREYWRNDRPDSTGAGPSVTVTTRPINTDPWPSVDCSDIGSLTEKSDTKLNRVENWIDNSQFKDVEAAQSSSITSSQERINLDISSSDIRPRSRSRSPILGMSSVKESKGSRVNTPVADSSTGLVIHKEESNEARRERENRASPRSDVSQRFSPKLSPRSDSRMSPKSDKERSSSPKVPPLRIIMPSKSSPTDESAKKIVTKALPYVLNPTQEGAEGVLLEGGEQCDQIASTSAEAEPLLPPTEADKVVKSGEADSVKSQNSDKSDKKEPPRETRESARIKEMKEKKQDSNEASEKSTSSKSSNNGSNGNKTKESGGGVGVVGGGAQTKEEPSKEEVTTSNGGAGGLAVTAAGGASGRCLRSQTKQLQQAEKKGGKDSDSSSSHEKDRDSKKSDPDTSDSKIPPRKRKLRQKEEKKEEEKTQSVPIPPPQVFEKPENPYELFLDIRKQIISRRATMFAVQPKAPDGFKDYLLVSNNYVLAGNPQSRIAVPMLPPPNSVQGGAMKDCFVSQEKERYKLRLQHKMEREKLMLAMEQEIVRVHGRAARAMANQALPFSVCSVLREEDIYNSFDSEQVRKAALKDVVNMEKDKNVRSRYNGRQFISWLQDVDDKYEKIKEALLLRHHHEAESLNAVQKLEWEWKLKEFGMIDNKATPKIDEVHVPMVHVKDEFDLLPS